MILNILSKAQHNQVLFLVSLPQEPEFMVHSASVARCTSQIKKMGVDVIEDINTETLSRANEYDVVIVVAHLDDRSNELVLSNRTIPLEEFVRALPKDFSGTLDFSSCNSSLVYDNIKKQCPNCTVKAANEEVGLNLRLSVYPSFIKRILKKHKKSYDQIYDEELKKAEFFYNRVHSSRATSIQRSQKLGKGKSAVFAPIQVAKSKPFQIIVRFQQDEEAETMSFKSLFLDSSHHVQINTASVPVKPGDLISAQLKLISKEKELIHVKDEINSFELEWHGGMCKKAFQVLVDPIFSESFFIGGLTVSINGAGIGECVFLTSIAADTNDSIIDVPFILYHSGQTQSETKAIIEAFIAGQIDNLKSRLSETKDKDKQSALNKDINKCENFLLEVNKLYG